MPPSRAENLHPDEPAPVAAPAATPVVGIQKFWRNPRPPEESVRGPLPLSSGNVQQHARSKESEDAKQLQAPPIQELTKRRFLIQEERAQRKPPQSEVQTHKQTASALPTEKLAAAETEQLKEHKSLTPVMPAASLIEPTMTEPTMTEPTMIESTVVESTVPTGSLTNAAKPADALTETASYVELPDSKAQEADKARAASLPKFNIEPLRAQLGLISANISARATRVKIALTSVRSRTITACSAMARSFAGIGASLQRKYEAQEFQRRMHGVRDQVRERLARRSLRDRSPHSEEKQPELIHASEAAGLQSTTGERWRAATETILRIRYRASAIAGETSIAIRLLWNRRLRIRIAGPNLNSLTGKFSRAVIETRRALQQNSRLVTSMALAGLSALLALGMILTVNRYQPGHSSASQNSYGSFQPSASAATVTTSKPAATTTTPEPTAASTKPSAGRSTHARVFDSRTIKIAHTTVKTAAVRKPIHQRTNRRVDDDYVARDTYVRYGN